MPKAPNLETDLESHKGMLMRQIIFLLVVALVIGCGKTSAPTTQDTPSPASTEGPGATVQPSESDEQQAQGSWKMVKAELPPGDPEPKAEQLSAVSVVVKGKLVTLTTKNGRDQYFTFKLDSTHSPKQVDFVQADASGNPLPRGETFPAIYKQEGGELVIASAVESLPKGYRPKEFKAALTMGSAPGQQHVMVVVLHLKK
jgi:uncharacterized protein (TIGR03067 family)